MIMAEKTWTWAFIATFYDDINRTIDVCRACDVKALELHPSNLAGLREAEIVELRGLLADNGISVSSFHLPFSSEDDIASFYETTRKAVKRADKERRNEKEDGTGEGCGKERDKGNKRRKKKENIIKKKKE